MLENDFVVEFSPPVFSEIKSLEENRKQIFAARSARDLRSLLWSSIDNKTSLDLDQIEYAEELPNGDIRILIGIADVDAFAPKDSAIDKFAAQNTITVYTESEIFPMLPEKLSTDLTSLREGADRLAVVTEMNVGADGETKLVNIYQALVHNHAKLNYEETGAWLDESAAAPAEFSEVEGLREQILLQKKAAARLANFRRRKGALEFETIDRKSVV